MGANSISSETFVITPAQANKTDSIIYKVFLAIWGIFFGIMFIWLFQDPTFSFFDLSDFLIMAIILFGGILPFAIVIVSSKYKVIFNNKNSTITFQTFLSTRIINKEYVQEWGIKKVFMISGPFYSTSLQPLIIFKFDNGKQYQYALSVLWNNKKKLIIEKTQEILRKEPKNYGQAGFWKSE